MQRRVSIGTAGRVLTTAAIALAIASCSDVPTEATAVAGTDPRVSAKPTTGAKKAALHTARVRSDGTLVDGTALSAVRLSEGVYILTFPPPIGQCAAAANSASYQGFDLSVFRIVAQIGIGVAQGGVFDDVSVIVSLFASTDGSSEDSSFSLVLVCP